MHYTGTIWRPPYEASSLLLEVTAGCTHHRCKFCTLYADLPFQFRMSPVKDVEADLREARNQSRLWRNSQVSRIFLTGANPFVLKASRLLEIAKLVRTYFPETKTIGCFSRVTDIALKTDQELKILVKNLHIPVWFGALGASNPIPVQGTLPGEKREILSVLDRIIGQVSEERLQHYRRNLRHL
jgi:radical SAM superfamily enzyme YgiQ (UPF0313 family)